MSMNKIAALTLGVTALTAAVATPVFADGCGQYGQAPCYPTDLTINKQVQDPENGEYVENVSTAKFSLDGKVSYKLIVTNTSGETFHGVTVDDTVPENVFIDQVDMSYIDKDGKKPMTLSEDKKSVKFIINELPAGKTETMFILGHLAGPYPEDEQFCRDNWANVHASERPNGDKNFARICVAQSVEGAKELPVAGVQDLIFLAPFALTGLGGVALLKKKS